MVWLAIIGSASIQIRADDKYFEADVQRAVKRIKNVTIQLKADVDLTKASKKIRDLRYRITSKDAVLKVDADVAKAEAKLAKLLSKFIDRNMEFTATANTQGANTKLTELRDRFKNTRIPFTANADTAAARAQLAYAARNRTSTINARVDPVTMGALQGLFNTLTGTLPFETIKNSIAGVAANFEALAVKGTAVVAAVGAVSAEVLTLGANLLSVGGDITQVIGLAGVFPAALFGVVTAVKATTMAWQGFGDAMKEAKTPAQLKAQQEALAKLPPEARKAVVALREIRGEVQKPVQAAYWEGMGTSIQNLIEKKLPEFKKGMTEVGGAMGRYTAAAINAVANTDDFNDIFVNVTDTIDNLAKGMDPAIDALQRWIGIGSNYLPQFGNWVSDLAGKFDAWTKKAEETGQMNVWIETGIQRIQELGSIVKSTVGIFSGLTEAARLSGAPGLTEMAAGMREIRDIVNGEPFQSRLVTVLEGARVGAEAVGQGFKKLTGFIGESTGSIGLFLAKAGEVAGLTFESIKSLFNSDLGFGLYSAMEGMKSALEVLQPGFSHLGDAVGSMGEIAKSVLHEMAPSLNQLFDTVAKVLDAVKGGVIDAMPIFNEFIQNIMAAAQGPIVAFATAVGAILTGFSELPGAVQTVIMSIGLFLLLKNKFAGFFSGIGKSLNDESKSVGQAFAGIREGAKQTRGGVADSFSTLGAAMKNALVTSAEAGSKAFSPIIGRAEDAAERTKNAFSGVGNAFRQGLSIGPELDTVKTGFQNLGTNISQTARGMGDTLKGVGQDIVRAVVPEGLRNAASRVHNDLEPAREAFRNLVPAATEAGRQAGSGLGNGIRTASTGLLNALGGAWGLALGGATIALGMFAQEQAKTESEISSLSAALDEQSGAWNQSARKIFAAQVLDQNANWFDDLMRSGRRNMEELVRDTDMNMNKVMDILTDPKGRDGFVENWRKIRDAAGDGKDVNEELARSVGMTKEQLKGLSQTDLENLVRQFEKSAAKAAEAEQRTIALSKATGANKVEAAALAANFDTLNSATSSVDDKFRAFKQNLDITTGGFQNLRNGTRDFKESMFGMEDSVLGIGEKYKGVVAGATEGSKVLSESFRAAMFEADGTFSTGSRQAIEFSKSMDSARDAVLKAGITEFQRLRDAGAELPEAQAKALASMEPHLQSMRDGLAKLGFDSGQVNQIMGQLGLDPDKLRGALSLDTQDAEGKAQRLAIMLQAISNGNYSVALAASSDQVKEELLKVKAYKDAYEKDGWKGVVDLIDKAGPKADELLIKLSEAKNLEDIKKIIDVEANGLPKIAEATSGLDALNKKPVLPKNLEAIDGVTPVTLDALGTLRSFTTNEIPPASIRARDDTAAGTEAAKATMAATPNVFRDLIANNSTGDGTTQAQQTMLGLYDVTRSLYGNNAAGDGTAQAQGTMNSLLDVTRSLFGNNAAGAGTGAAQGTMNSLVDVTRALFASNETAGGKNAAQTTINSTADKTANIYAANKTHEGVNAANLTIAGVVGKTVDIITRFFKQDANADGGIYNGNGVRKFAGGGILKGVKTPQIKTYAGGGIENHVAQIARGAWPVRVWAEPETGGEAYLPLAKSKRKRSLEILRQVMEEFGLGHLAQFADGGVMKSMSMTQSRSPISGYNGDRTVVTTTAHAAAAPTIVTNVYPSQGLNEEQVADSVSENIFWRLSNKI